MEIVKKTINLMSHLSASFLLEQLPCFRSSLIYFIVCATRHRVALLPGHCI